jgi:hypothetical protein
MRALKNLQKYEQFVIPISSAISVIGFTVVVSSMTA